MAPDLKPGRQALYLSMPVTVLELIGHEEVIITLGEGAGAATVKRSELLALATPDEIFAKADIAAIPQAAWDVASRRADAVRELIAMETGRSKAVAQKAAELGIKPRQLWRLIGDYQRHESIRGMLPRIAGCKNGAKVLDLDVERIVAKTIDEYFLQPERPTQKALWERIDAACRERKLSSPSQRTIAKRLEAYQDRDSLRKRVGSKKAKYVCQPMPGHVDVQAPLDRVEIDHTPMDVMARSDDPQCGYVGRPWLTLAIDVFSRCILGFYIGFEPPSTLADALCMTHVMMPKNPAAEYGVPLDWPMHGKPKEVVVDNGKDFDSKAFQRGCDDAGIKLSFRPVGSPHYGGTIERLIGTMVGQCHLLPGTTKRSVQAKGDYDSVKHATLTLSELRRWFAEQVLGRYHVTEHRMLRIPPQVVWMRAMQGGQDD